MVYCQNCTIFVPRMKKIVTILLMLVALTGHAQAPKGQVELFCGAEMSYAKVSGARLYDVLVRLTPGVKWHMGNDWMLAGQTYVPVVNDGYKDRYSMLRLNMTTISKELHFPSTRQHLKLSAGLFGLERGGFDLRWHYPVNDWLMFMAQAGITSHWALGYKFDGQKESDFGGDWKFTGLIGVNVWVQKLGTEVRLSGGRYIDDMYGMELSLNHHFKYATVSAYLQYHEVAKGVHNMNKEWNLFFIGEHRQSVGVRLTFLLPPYKQSKRKVVIRPASIISFEWFAQQDEEIQNMYKTDPEENERTYPVNVNWGIMKQSELEEK